MSAQQSIRRGSAWRHPIRLALLPSLFLLSACSKQETPGNVVSDKPRIEETTRGPISIAFSFDPPVVRLDRDILLTIRTSAPTNYAVKLPPLENRVKGFTVSGGYDTAPAISGGKSIREHRVRLTPQIAREYRLAPMAITWKQAGSTTENWFPTKPVVLSTEALVKGDAGRTLADPATPVWIYPGLKGILGYTLALAGLLALGYGAWRVARKIHRAVKLHRMSPRERALFELAELLERDLVGHNRVKEFYFELTMIVRLYIERAHSIRAPEQTTEEFLDAVSQDPRFSRDVIRRLREFMQAADLVKYAGFRPDIQAVTSALTTARSYIETDSAPAQSPIPNPKSQI